MLSMWEAGWKGWYLNCKPLCRPVTQQMHMTEEAENQASQPPNQTETDVLK